MLGPGVKLNVCVPGLYTQPMSIADEFPGDVWVQISIEAGRLLLVNRAAAASCRERRAEIMGAFGVIEMPSSDPHEYQYVWGKRAPGSLGVIPYRATGPAIIHACGCRQYYAVTPGVLGASRERYEMVPADAPPARVAVCARGRELFGPYVYTSADGQLVSAGDRPIKKYAPSLRNPPERTTVAPGWYY